MFVSLEFWLFVAVTLLLYYLIPGKWQNLLLLVASYLIYAYLEPGFVLLLAAMTLFNFWIARFIQSNAPHHRRYFWAAVIVNVGVLALFKYGLGIPELVNPLLNKLGLPNEVLTVNLLLPLGLSFYSFRALAYVFDINNQLIKPENSLVDFGLYIAFFPQIVAGPIVRPQPFITALKNRRSLTQERLVDGITFIFMGFFYKVAIADPLFTTLQSSATNIGTLSSADAWSALILYTVRIYADFAGYSLLAIGVSVWFGLPVVENFRQPYFSRTVSIFWDRWHISLSTWIRDYTFYPTSRFLLRRLGNQWARTIQVIALIISMTISGMWHGTGWTFVVWGALHGVYLSLERLFFPKVRVKPKKVTWRFWVQGALGMTVTLIAVSAAWVFFRADTLSDAFIFFERLFSSNPFDTINALWWIKVLVPIALLLIIDLPQLLTDNALVLWRLRSIWRIALCTIMLLGIFIFGSQTHAPFIYSGF
ncbi:MAG: hypothetical protein GC179_22885 [Anaerolineaceae bacterium]|nr:hypothetical protein [Anaerolineaceae bacterium]